MDILGPLADYEDTNNQSVVCKVTFGSRKFLFMGDAETQAEDALLSAGTDLSADVVKLGHHGSKSSSQKEFLQAVGPQYALISCGGGEPLRAPRRGDAHHAGHPAHSGVPHRFERDDHADQRRADDFHRNGKGMMLACSQAALCVGVRREPA